MALRPYQDAGIAKWSSRKDKRLIFAWATSAGKSLAAIRCAESIGARRVLVVVPAMGRPTWVKECAKWSTYDPHSIIYGRNRTGLSKVKTAQSAAAYAADVQVVSYNLLKELDPHARDLIVLDEIHALRDPLSKQSKIVRAYFRAHPTTPALGLSATPIPTDVKQIWNPLDTFWPSQFGRAAANGGISWQFQASYCFREENEYGVKYSGSKSPEALTELAARLEPYIHRVTDREVAAYLPKLHASPLYVDERRTESSLAVEWLENLGERTGPVAVVCFNRETAAELASVLETDFLVSGESTPEQRQRVLDQAAQTPNAILVATSESVRESVSLSFCKQALILQWRTSPAQAIQLMGRFPRQDADIAMPCYIQYAVLPGDEARAETLTRRISDIQALMRADEKSKRLVEIFKPRELTDDRLEAMFNNMFSVVVSDGTEWETED